MDENVNSSRVIERQPTLPVELMSITRLTSYFRESPNCYQPEISALPAIRGRGQEDVDYRLLSPLAMPFPLNAVIDCLARVDGAVQVCARGSEGKDKIACVRAPGLRVVNRDAALGGVGPEGG